jgi:antirestriction protein
MTTTIIAPSLSVPVNIPANTDDVIDSRDVIAAVDALNELVDPHFDAVRDALVKLATEGEMYAEDWLYGETLIRDSYFVEYARELAYDIGVVTTDMHWPLDHIDWEAAANALRGDYTGIDFDGVTYWTR